jgi:hypothetical protein
LIGAMAAQEDTWLDPDRRLQTLASLLHRHNLDWVTDSTHAVRVLLAHAVRDDVDRWIERLASILRDPKAPREPVAGAILLAALKAWCDRDFTGFPGPQRLLRVSLRQWIRTTFSADQASQEVRAGRLATADAVARVRPTLSPLGALILLYIAAPQGARWDAESLAAIADTMESLTPTFDGLLALLGRVHAAAEAKGVAPSAGAAGPLARLGELVHRSVPRAVDGSEVTHQQMLLKEALEELFPQDDDYNARRAVRLIHTLKPYTDDEVGWAMLAFRGELRNAIRDGARRGDKGDFSTVTAILERARRDS